jgi:hypothetical protein
VGRLMGRLENALRALTARPAPAARSLSLDEWTSWLSFENFPLMLNQGLNGKEEEIGSHFSGLVQGGLRSNGIVFACEMARIMLFSEARFAFRRLRSGRPGDLFSTPALRPLADPSKGRTTGDLLTRAMQHADFGGTGFLVRRGDRIRQPRPDWVTMVYGSFDDPAMTPDDIDADLLGILYHPGGRSAGVRPVSILEPSVGLFAPVPDPLGMRRGIPWVSAVTRNIMGHNAATTHKLKFFENGATPQMIVSLDASITDPVKFRQWVEVLEQDHKGVTNAYKTLYLGAGAKGEVVGANLAQLDLKATMGADETIIAAAAQVPPVVAGLSEGLQGSSLNAGNFASSMRRFADLFARPNWRNMAGSLANIIDVPSDAEMWYYDRDIPALKDDIRDAAEVQSAQSASIRNLIDSGWEAESIKTAVVSGDWTQLRHTGLFSVQLQPPMPDRPIQLEAKPVPVPQLTAGRSGEVRCQSCGKLVARALGPGTDLDCPRCKAPLTA